MGRRPIAPDDARPRRIIEKDGSIGRRQVALERAHGNAVNLARCQAPMTEAPPVFCWTDEGGPDGYGIAACRPHRQRYPDRMATILRGARLELEDAHKPSDI